MPDEMNWGEVEPSHGGSGIEVRQGLSTPWPWVLDRKLGAPLHTAAFLREYGPSKG